MAAKVEAVNNAIGLFNVAPTDENKNGLDTDKAALQAYRASIKERNESKKFAAGLHQSERATKHFSRAPQHNYLRTPITELKQDNGSVTKDPGKIADGHPRYGGNLFLSTSPDLVSTRTAVYHPLRLAKLLRDTPAKPVTASGFYWAIMKSTNEKAPGPDRLPIEYYKLVPSLWTRIYEVIHDFQLSKGKMTKFQRRAHLSLLYKAGDRSLRDKY
uniref:Uncharacterized protein n=1 Tax=Phytophthora fragariae TaxID=53985 RepID=A0A6A3DHD7_9STRA|nr:hypothetical protein PF009_g28892 [Phytophthora fragariae]